ncbi:YraN family protein [Solimonas sp. K1W22B-7]|uniref:YraN family protein n=1 Tax=Solimonas sp. K1W22B-7 TaxID=2303331 RepID=UPI000E3374DB|nr:YraN family protein [Solimonas sp. K1W22B-7]AXQ28179.1 YraN family protein [Solimonas sp. K1W22B-7]
MTGAEAEDLALRLLQKRGLKLLQRNYRCRGGELDLVMLHGDTLAVIEVRSRSNPGYGTAAESVDARKQRRIVLATQMFLVTHPGHGNRPVRFDVVAFDAGGKPDWITAAFDAV